MSTHTIEEKQHTRLAPSASKIWLTCTKAPELMALFPDVEIEDEFSSEGTTAHWHAEMLLKGRVTMDEIPEAFKELQFYLDKVKEIQTNGNLMVEVKTSMTEAFESPEKIEGTSDVVILQKDGSIDIADLKWGMGVKVTAVENTQALTYAVGVLYFLQSLGLVDLDELPKETKITTHIIQPRIAYNQYTFHVITYADVLAFIERAREAIRNIFSGEGVLVKGPHCQFCKGKALCPMFTKPVEDVADIQVLPAMIDIKPEAKLELLTPERLIDLYKIKGDVLAFYRALDKYLAAQIAASGTKTFMGYKAVKVQGDRFISDISALEAQLKEAGVETSMLQTTKAIGMRELDKIANAVGIVPETLKGISKKLETRIVSATDFRDALFAEE